MLAIVESATQKCLIRTRDHAANEIITAKAPEETNDRLLALQVDLINAILGGHRPSDDATHKEAASSEHQGLNDKMGDRNDEEMSLKPSKRNKNDIKSTKR